jgi:hypothetical protein
MADEMFQMSDVKWYRPLRYAAAATTGMAVAALSLGRERGRVGKRAVVMEYPCQCSTINSTREAVGSRCRVTEAFAGKQAKVVDVRAMAAACRAVGRIGR